jgi:hypothetical protein
VRVRPLLNRPVASQPYNPSWAKLVRICLAVDVADGLAEVVRLGLPRR